jgi:thiol-disulfide isomerase/thioredoxin
MKDGTPVPAPYTSDEMDVAKAVEKERGPCGFSQDDHTCVVIDVPLKKWSHLAGYGRAVVRLADGMSRFAIDTETGALVRSQTERLIEDQWGSYHSSLQYTLKKISHESPPDSALFELPHSGMRQVKRLTPWSTERIRKQLVGKPAPELEVNDIQGNPISLSHLKGKTVLLDFWATWCPPCVADAPALEKLYRQYSSKGLMIVGVSVGEDRRAVERFLKRHAHSYPIVLTTENEMPRQYQVGVFPTYIVITPDGTLASIVDGDKGFGALRKLLDKAGMNVE